MRFVWSKLLDNGDVWVGRKNNVFERGTSVPKYTASYPRGLIFLVTATATSNFSDVPLLTYKASFVNVNVCLVLATLTRIFEVFWLHND